MYVCPTVSELRFYGCCYLCLHLRCWWFWCCLINSGKLEVMVVVELIFRIPVSGTARVAIIRLIWPSANKQGQHLQIIHGFIYLPILYSSAYISWHLYNVFLVWWWYPLPKIAINLPRTYTEKLHCKEETYRFSG